MNYFCEYCDEELSEEKGELAHGCLRCHYDPRVDKIMHLKKALKEACEVIGCFQNKTAVYLTIYDGDKELRKYRENAEIFLAKMEEVKNGNG